MKCDHLGEKHPCKIISIRHIAQTHFNPLNKQKTTYHNIRQNPCIYRYLITIYRSAVISF